MKCTSLELDTPTKPTTQHDQNTTIGRLAASVDALVTGVHYLQIHIYTRLPTLALPALPATPGFKFNTPRTPEGGIFPAQFFSLRRAPKTGVKAEGEAAAEQSKKEQQASNEALSASTTPLAGAVTGAGQTTQQATSVEVGAGGGWCCLLCYLLSLHCGFLFLNKRKIQTTNTGREAGGQGPHDYDGRRRPGLDGEGQGPGAGAGPTQDGPPLRRCVRT